MKYIPKNYFLISKTDSAEIYIINTYTETNPTYAFPPSIPRYTDLITITNDSIISSLNIAYYTYDWRENRIIYNVNESLKVNLYETSCRDWNIEFQGFPTDTVGITSYHIERNGQIIKLE